MLLLCMFSILYYMTFTQIYLYPTGGQVTNTKYDIPFTAELVKEWGPKWKVKDEKQYQEKQSGIRKRILLKNHKTKIKSFQKEGLWIMKFFNKKI